MPEEALPGNLYYADATHQLRRNDPRQIEMELRSLPEEETTLRRIGGE